MKQFKLADADSLEESDVVILGVPTDLGAMSERKGRFKAPDKIREISKFLYDPERGKIDEKIFDAGNLNQSSEDIRENLKEIEEKITELAKKNKKMIVLGGDCSIKYGICRGLNNLNKKIGIIYFDSHPDFVESDIPNYGSVMADSIKLGNVDPKGCIILGIRNIEDREIKAMNANKVAFLTALDIKEIGLDETIKKINDIISKADIVQLSIDLDSIDPAFAPGVGLPCPGGLTSIEILYLLKGITKSKIYTLDLTEYIPDFDFNDTTAQLACRIVQEFLSK
ncbi:MAG: arginase family protein [Nanoarchaeota archaeon]